MSDTHTLTRTRLVLALPLGGSRGEAIAGATGLIVAAETTRNAYVLSFALLAYGVAFIDADPDRAREALGRGLVIAQDSGARVVETHLASSLALLEAKSGDPLAALGYFTVAIPNYYDSGNIGMIRLSPRRSRSEVYLVEHRQMPRQDAVNLPPTSPLMPITGIPRRRAAG